MVLGINRPAGEVGAVWPAIAVGTFVAFGGVLFGTRALIHHSAPQELANTTLA
jgi:hypothetical protein